jgi:hypothetical protein
VENKGIEFELACTVSTKFNSLAGELCLREKNMLVDGRDERKRRETKTYARVDGKASYARTCCRQVRWGDGMGRGASIA